MINFLKHNEIDREKWDNCVKNSPRSKPYGYSWYLDIMSPGWEALIDDDYDAVFPLPVRKKLGFSYLSTPPFLQQLGAFSPDKPVVSVINEFLEFMPDFYWLIDLRIGQTISHDGFRVALRSNYELALSKPYKKLKDSFSEECRRNIGKASKKKPELDTDLIPGELVELFIANSEKQIKGIKPVDFQHLRELMEFCLRNRKGRLIGVRKGRNKLIYGIFLIEVKGSITMQLIADTPESREKRIGYYVVNELIKEAAGTRTILDFAGSPIPSVASFMESFGSVNNPYCRIYHNSLPWPLRLMI